MSSNVNCCSFLSEPMAAPPTLSNPSNSVVVDDLTKALYAENADTWTFAAPPDVPKSPELGHDLSPQPATTTKDDGKPAVASSPLLPKLVALTDGDQYPSGHCE